MSWGPQLGVPGTVHTPVLPIRPRRVGIFPSSRMSFSCCVTFDLWHITSLSLVFPPRNGDLFPHVKCKYLAKKSIKSARCLY